MGKMTINPPDDLINTIKRMGDLDRIAPKMLDAGIEPVAKAVKKNLQNHRVSGELIDSVTQGKPKKNKKGIWEAKVSFKGKDSETGVANGQKAMSLEYGTSKQDATPFLRPAIIETEEQSIAAMQDIFEFEVGLKSL